MASVQTHLHYIANEGLKAVCLLNNILRDIPLKWLLTFLTHNYVSPVLSHCCDTRVFLMRKY